MPATTVTPKHLLHEGTPAQIREALTSEDQCAFEESFRRALDDAGRNYSMDAVDDCLAHWRATAAQQAHMGHDAWREMLAKADRILAGRPDPGSRPWREVKVELGL